MSNYILLKMRILDLNCYLNNQRVERGDKRIRTTDIRRAKAALYQLSYIPRYSHKSF